jgi:hypothetical protein
MTEENQMSEISNIFQQDKQNSEEKKKQQIAQTLAAAKKKQEDEAAQAIMDEQKKKARYGSGAVPMTEYLGTSQSGVRKTLLGG